MNRGEIALKVVNGERLTAAEFKLAQQEGIFDRCLTYQDYDGDYYSSPTLQGYICAYHPDRASGETPDSGCGWGLHAINDLEGRYLSENNKRMLVKFFGDDILEQIPHSRVLANEKTCEDCRQDPDECPNCIDFNGCATKYKSPDIEEPNNV